MVQSSCLANLSSPVSFCSVAFEIYAVILKYILLTVAPTWQQVSPGLCSFSLYPELSPLWTAASHSFPPPPPGRLVQLFRVGVEVLWVCHCWARAGFYSLDIYSGPSHACWRTPPPARSIQIGAFFRECAGAVQHPRLLQQPPKQPLRFFLFSHTAAAPVLACSYSLCLDVDSVPQFIAVSFPDALCVALASPFVLKPLVCMCCQCPPTSRNKRNRFRSVYQLCLSLAVRSCLEWAVPILTNQSVLAWVSAAMILFAVSFTQLYSCRNTFLIQMS